MVIPGYDIGTREVREFTACHNRYYRSCDEPMVVAIIELRHCPNGAVVRLNRLESILPSSCVEEGHISREIPITPEIEGVILGIVNGDSGCSAPMWDYVEDMA